MSWRRTGLPVPRSSSSARAQLDHRALDDDPDPVREGRRIDEVVRDDQRRERELAKQRPELGSHLSAAYARSSAASGSSSSSTRGPRASARARPTRWRSPPDSCPGRAFASPAIPNRSSSSAAVLPANSTLLRDRHMREERVLLDDVADRALAPAASRSPRPSNTRLALDLDCPAPRPRQPGDRVEDGGFSGSRGADERDRLAADLER